MVKYDTYYKSKNLFGEPYPELIAFYSSIEQKGKLLDLGCGQGRDSIPLAKLGYSVVGIDNSKVGIEQLNTIANKENLPLKGFVDDIYSYSKFDEFDFILLDSMFHFGKKEREKEVAFLNRLLDKSSPNTLITICIQNAGEKLNILDSIILSHKKLDLVNRVNLIYHFKDKESNHSSKSKYEMITVKKKE